MAPTWVLFSFDILQCNGDRPSGFGLKMKKRLRDVSSSFLFPVPVSSQIFSFFGRMRFFTDYPENATKINAENLKKIAKKSDKSES